MAFKQNNPLSRKTSPINRDWIKGAIKRPGAFKKKAEEAGMSTKEFANKVTSNKEDYSARTGKQAELAETLMGMSRHKSGHVNPEQGDFDYEDPNYRNTPEYKKFKRKQKRKKRKNKGKDPDQEIVERDNNLSREANEDMGMSRKASPLNAGKMSGKSIGKRNDNTVDEVVVTTERKRGTREDIKANKAKDKNKGEDKSTIRKRKTQDKIVKAKKATEKAENRDDEKLARAKANRLQKRAARQEGRSERKAARKSGKTRGERRKAVIDSREKQKKAVKNIDKTSSPANRKASPLNAEKTRNPLTNSPVGDISGDKIYGPATAAIHVGKKIIKKGKKFVEGAAKLGKKVGKKIKETSEAAQTGGPYKK